MHKRDCLNVISSLKDPTQVDRWIPVHWENAAPASYRSTLDIVADSRNGLIADVGLVLANFRVPIHELNAREPVSYTHLPCSCRAGCVGDACSGVWTLRFADFPSGL